MNALALAIWVVWIAGASTVYVLARVRVRQLRQRVIALQKRVRYSV